MTLMLPLLLSACHLFTPTPTVECVVGEPCAQPTTDSADTGDTDEPVGPTPARGWMIGLDAGEKSAFRLYAPDASFVGDWKGFTGSGQVAYDEETGQGLGITPDGVFLLNGDATSTSISSAPEYLIADVAWYGGYVLVTGMSDQGFLSLFDPVAGDGSSLETDVAPFGGIAVSGDASRILYLDAQPTLYAVDTSFNVKEKAKAYDVDSALSDAVAIGPDGETFVCSAEGAIYAVTSLQAGDRKALVVYDGTISDVIACTWDKGDETWVLGSVSVGIIRIDSAGRSEIVFEPPNGYTVADISFY